MRSHHGAAVVAAHSNKRAVLCGGRWGWLRTVTKGQVVAPHSNKRAPPAAAAQYGAVVTVRRRNRGAVVAPHSNKLCARGVRTEIMIKAGVR